MTISDLPFVNACLNTLSACFLAAGFAFIRRKKQEAHRRCMIAALITSTLFLASYLFYHWYRVNYLGLGVTRFPDLGLIRTVYLVILGSHTILAVVILPLVFVSFFLAFRQRFDAHRKIARWTWPLWMYVSVTGVIIYVMLYQLYAPVER